MSGDDWQVVEEAFELVYREHDEQADAALAAIARLRERMEAYETPGYITSVQAVVDARQEVARLREREAQLERERDDWKETARRESEGWQLAVDRGRALQAAEARVAELKEYADENFTALMDEREKAIAAEARVAQLESTLMKALHNSEQLEEALREIAESPAMTDVDMIPASTMRSLRAVARRALAHEEEK